MRRSFTTPSSNTSTRLFQLYCFISVALAVRAFVSWAAMPAFAAAAGWAGAGSDQPKTTSGEAGTGKVFMSESPPCLVPSWRRYPQKRPPPPAPPNRPPHPPPPNPPRDRPPHPPPPPERSLQPPPLLLPPHRLAPLW